MNLTKSGISWNGFKLEGDNKSVNEVVRLIHLEERLKWFEEENKRLTHQLNDASWALNPDRSGGAFTQEEIDRAKEWR